MLRIAEGTAARSAAMTAAEEVDQAVGRAVFGSVLLAADQARIHALAQLLAQFHAPLIEGVGAPDHALGEHLVLVQGDQSAQASRTDPFEHQGVARPVAGY